MQINRKTVEEQFTSYVSGYDLADVKVRLKAEHTLRVAALCDRIADSLYMTGKEKDLAWLLGMLHDIGRFEQLRRFHTFRDGLSVNHAELGADLLFKDKLIRRFVETTTDEKDGRYSVSAAQQETAVTNIHKAPVQNTKKTGVGDSDIANRSKMRITGFGPVVMDGAEADAALIEKAIRCHNSYALPEALSPREYRFASLLRDADKIDILRVNIETPRSEIYDVPDKMFLMSPITASVLENILQWRNIDRRTMRTPADLLLGHISFVFGLVYRESVRQIKEQGYLEKLLHFPSQNPETAESFARIRERIYEYIERRLAYPAEGSSQ